MLTEKSLEVLWQTRFGQVSQHSWQAWCNEGALLCRFRRNIEAPRRQSWLQSGTLDHPETKLDPAYLYSSLGRVWSRPRSKLLYLSCWPPSERVWFLIWSGKVRGQSWFDLSNVQHLTKYRNQPKFQTVFGQTHRALKSNGPLRLKVQLSCGQAIIGRLEIPGGTRFIGTIPKHRLDHVTINFGQVILRLVRSYLAKTGK